MIMRTREKMMVRGSSRGDDRSDGDVGKRKQEQERQEKRKRGEQRTE